MLSADKYSINILTALATVKKKTLRINDSIGRRYFNDQVTKLGRVLFFSSAKDWLLWMPIIPPCWLQYKLEADGGRSIMHGLRQLNHAYVHYVLKSSPIAV